MATRDSVAFALDDLAAGHSLIVRDADQGNWTDPVLTVAPRAAPGIQVRHITG